MDTEEAFNYIKETGPHYSGPTGPRSFKNIISTACDLIRAGVTSDDLPESPLVTTLADRVTQRASRDTLIMIESKKGSGKSTLACELAYQISKALVKRIGGKPSDYFGPHCLIVLNDIRSIFDKLKEIPKYSIIILDDLGIAANSRESQKGGNIGLGNILMISRTKRWTLITTSPLRNQTDKNVRVLSDYIIRPQQMFPSVKDGTKTIERGFNICKIYATTINPVNGKEYTSHIRARCTDGKMRQIKYHVFFYPPDEIIKPYEQARDEATDLVIERIANKGDFNAIDKPKRKTAEDILEENREVIVEMMSASKKPTETDIAARLKVSNTIARKIKSLYKFGGFE